MLRLIVFMDYINEAGLPPPFFEWVAGKRGGDNPRGDFIRDTLRLIKQGVAEADLEWKVKLGCQEAENEYRKLKSEYRRKFGTDPSDPKYRHRPERAVDLSWSEIRWRVLPYVVYICRNGNIVIGNRRYLPLWVWDREPGSVVGTPDWRPVNERSFVKGIIISLHTYNDSNSHLPRKKMLAHVSAKLEDFRLGGLPPDWDGHRQATDRRAWDAIGLPSEEERSGESITLNFR